MAGVATATATATSTPTLQPTRHEHAGMGIAHINITHAQTSSSSSTTTTTSSTPTINTNTTPAAIPPILQNVQKWVTEDQWVIVDAVTYQVILHTRTGIQEVKDRLEKVTSPVLVFVRKMTSNHPTIFVIYYDPTSPNPNSSPTSATSPIRGTGTLTLPPLLARRHSTPDAPATTARQSPPPSIRTVAEDDTHTLSSTNPIRMPISRRGSADDTSHLMFNCRSSSHSAVASGSASPLQLPTIHWDGPDHIRISGISEDNTPTASTPTASQSKTSIFTFPTTSTQTSTSADTSLSSSSSSSSSSSASSASSTSSTSSASTSISTSASTSTSTSTSSSSTSSSSSSSTSTSTSVPPSIITSTPSPPSVRDPILSFFPECIWIDLFTPKHLKPHLFIEAHQGSSSVSPTHRAYRSNSKLDGNQQFNVDYSGDEAKITVIPPSHEPRTAPHPLTSSSTNNHHSANNTLHGSLFNLHSHGPSSSIYHTHPAPHARHTSLTFPSSRARQRSLRFDLKIDEKSLKQAYDDLTSHHSQNTWMILGCFPNTETVRVLNIGMGKIEEMRDALPKGRVAIGIIRAAVENVPRMSASRIKCVAIIITPSLGHTNDADRSMLVHQHRIIKIFDGIHLTRTFEIAKLQDYDGLTTTWLQDELHKVLQIDSIMIRIIRAYSGESTQNGMDFQRVYLERHATVGTLQEILQERFKIAVTQQRITRVTSAFANTYGGVIISRTVLSDPHKKLTSDYGIVNGDKLYLEESSSDVVAPRYESRGAAGTLAAERIHELEQSLRFRKIDDPGKYHQKTPSRAESKQASPDTTPTETRPVTSLPSSTATSSLYDDDSNMIGEDDSDDRWEIDPAEILIVKERVGIGKTAIVHKGIWRLAEVAYKQLQYVMRTDKVPEKVWAPFIEEISTLRKLRHKNIVMLVGVCTDPRNLAIITEWVPRGSLRDVLISPSIKLTFEDILKMALDITDGMAYLHSKRIIHRDLKSHNLLVDENWTVKVADFGYAKQMLTDQSKAMTEVGTSGWVAPEVLNAGETDGYDLTVDVFSFGTVAWELVTRGIPNPLSGVAPIPYYNMVMNQQLPDLPEWCPEDFVALVKSCWSFEPSRRPDFVHINTEIKRILAQAQDRKYADLDIPACTTPDMS